MTSIGTNVRRWGVVLSRAFTHQRRARYSDIVPSLCADRMDHTRRVRRRRSALPTTETDDKLIASAASMGDSSHPVME
jgi:hypothetical protein